MFALNALALSLIAVVLGGDSNGLALTKQATGLTLFSFDNSGMANNPTTTEVVTSLDSVTLKNALSGIISGNIEFPNAGHVYEFQCNFENTSLAFVWVDGHLICQDNNAYVPDLRTIDNPLPIRTKTSLPFRAHLYKDELVESARLSVRWRNLGNLGNLGNNDKRKKYGGEFEVITDRYLSPDLSAAEKERDLIQREASKGFGNLLHHNMLTFTNLPSGAAITLQLCQISSKKCITVATPDGISRIGADVRVGPYSFDRSYGELVCARAEPAPA